MYAEHPTDVPLMTEAEYIAFADEQEFKYEFLRGRVYAMTGASVRHNIISANSIIHLGNRLADRDCTVTSSDTRVYIASKKTYRYPDVTVFCGEPTFLKGRRDTITDPVLLVEVLSPGTAVRDTNEKLEEYTQIESLQAYVLIAQDTPKVEVYRRHDAGKWLYEYATGMDAEITFPIVGTELGLSLAQIYRRVQWDEPSLGDDETEDDE